MARLAPGLAVSLLLHAGLLALALWMLSLRQPAPEIRIGSVPVTIVSDVIREAAPTSAPAEELFDEVTPDAAEESEAETVAAEAPDPTPARPSPERPPPERPTPSPRPERPQPRPERPTPPQRETSALNLDDLAGGGQRGSDRPRRPGRPATESGAGDAAALTGPQVAAIGQQVVPHWDLFFCDLAGGDNLIIRVEFTLSANGRITDGPRLVRPENGSVWQAAARSTLTAVRRAEPFRVPEGFEGQELLLTYRTANACRR